MRKNWVKKGFVYGIIVLMVGASIVPISCANEKVIVYVDDENTLGPWDGSWNYPYKTIMQGIKNVSEGGTVYVGNGLYSEHVVIDRSLNLMRTNIVYPGNTQNFLIIDGGGVDTVITIYKVKEYGVKIDGFKIQNSGIGFNDAGIYISQSENCVVCHNNLSNNGNGIIIIDSTTIHINDSVLYNNLIGDGILIDGHSRDISIVQNTIYNCKEFGISSSTETDNSNINIYNNCIFSCSYDGVKLDTSSSGIKINYNKIYNCGIRPPSNESGNGIKVVNSHGVEIRHNNIINTTSGISIIGSSDSVDILIMNNSVSECYHNGICIKLNVGAECYYNNIYRNGLNFSKSGSGVYIEGNVNENNFNIKYNYIHENLINIVVASSRCFKYPGHFTQNNITEPVQYHFYGYKNTVHAEHNYWGLEYYPPFKKCKRDFSFFMIHPCSDHSWL